ncbi:carboxypeptidase M32 [Ammoniphilus sp. CFH 90114]|uniref:carboxypeptidase M32 n=1 Tax=Ammoniphilus sp. CFH 90114 TaxID=2493665 RepID=UPI0021046AD6|nr:carboxypeptidase M32 [Ammoniphilus sp. CFH 90114]
MNETIDSIEEQFLRYIKKMMQMKEATDLMFWDLRTGAPSKGASLRSEALGTISSMIFEMSTSSEMKYYLEALTDRSSYPSLSPRTRRIIEEVKKEYDRNTRIPREEYQAYMNVKSIATTVWEEAKMKSDFTIFQPYLEQLVEWNKRFISYWRIEGKKYDALLQIYDPGVTVDILDAVTHKLKENLLPLLRTIGSRAEPNTSFLYQSFPKEKQKILIHHVLQEIGYDFERGRLDESVHPFALTINPHDVRVTTHYLEQDFTYGLSGAIHEGGHALYEQNISPDLIGTPLCEGASWGMHESQSLFWEKMIGLHPGFCRRYYPLLQELQPNPFERVEFQDFYRALHVVKPSFIRVEADELTYPFHVMIRYEIEKALFEDHLEVKDLLQLWNEKMKANFGIVPLTDRQGVLQDMHWSMGLFGQFPSYLLGILYAAQFRNTMMRELPNFHQLVSNGDLTSIREWLSKNVHVHGKMKTPNELLLDVTGEELNPDHLIRYFQEKYSEIYEISPF